MANQITNRKKLDRQRQISFRSTPEIVRGLDFAASRLALVMDFDGRKLKCGHFVSALAKWVATLETPELDAFMRPKMKELERYLEGGHQIEEPHVTAHGVTIEPKQRKVPA